ncbi:MAG TPA: MBL fold metallo-hydrolase [Acidobacteriota bacterium]|nr:MBL fold metallo-hydrolase [Acidobacteriota bacterium]
MKQIRVAGLTFLAALCLWHCTADTANSRPQTSVVSTEASYRAAHEIVLRASDALADEEGQLPSFAVLGKGRLNLAAQFQGTATEGDTWVEYEESLAYLSDRGWSGYSQEYQRPDGSRESLRFVYIPPDEMRLVHLVDKFAIHLAGAGFAHDRRRVARMMPPFLLRGAMDQRSALRYLGSRRGGQGPVDLVTLPLDGETVTLLFDQHQGHLSGLEYLADVPLLGDTLISWEFLDWSDTDELRHPAGYRIRVGDRMLKEVRYQSVTTTNVEQAPVFQVPAEIPVPSEPRRIEPRSGSLQPRPSPREVAPGVYFVPNLRTGFHVMFVDLGEEIAAFEAPTGWLELHQLPASDFVAGASSGSVSRQYIDLIREAVPGKPIRYLVLSHHHGDHAGGLREFLAAGATIVTAADLSGIVRRALQRPHTLDPGAPELTASDLRLEEFSASRMLGEGPNRIELLEFEGNSHAQGMAVMHLPQQGILYVADLAYAWPAAGRPSAAHLAPTRGLARWLRQRNLRPQRIYTSHGAAASVSWGDLERVLSEEDLAPAGEQ